jgi:DNA-binding transcriptional LysR family regulator
MDMGSLSSFVAVYDSGSITKAAQGLYMSPQGLSKSIARLEKEVRAQLFVRSRQGVVPTKYAKTLYPKAKSLVETVASIRMEASKREPYYSLSVVLSDGMIAYLGLGFIAAFENEHPGVELRIHECSNLAVEDFLLAEEAEIGFLIGPVNESKFSCTFFQSVPHVLIVSDDSSLSQKDAVAFSDLEDQTVFHLGCDYPVGKNLSDRLALAGVFPAATIGIVGADTVLPHVMRNEGVLVSADVWARMSQRGL